MAEFKKLTLEINGGNAAFDDDPESEIVRILESAIENIKDGNDSRLLMDINGNRVGFYEVDMDDDD